MRKEIIIRMHVKSDKCQAKAMKVAAAVSGVESVTLAGGDKSLLLVIGAGVDSNKLVKKLKKKVGEAEIVELRTHDTFEAAALPLPGTKQEVAAMRSPYNGSHRQWQYSSSYAAAPASPYAYHYYPSPVGAAAGGVRPRPRLRLRLRRLRGQGQQLLAGGGAEPPGQLLAAGGEARLPAHGPQLLLLLQQQAEAEHGGGAAPWRRQQHLHYPLACCMLYRVRRWCGHDRRRCRGTPCCFPS